AEDGIRGFHVTGVQTCALPISAPRAPLPPTPATDPVADEKGERRDLLALPFSVIPSNHAEVPPPRRCRRPPRCRGGGPERHCRRSEARRVGEERRTRVWPSPRD